MELQKAVIIIFLQTCRSYGAIDNTGLNLLIWNRKSNPPNMQTPIKNSQIQNPK